MITAVHDPWMILQNPAEMCTELEFLDLFSNLGQTIRFQTGNSTCQIKLFYRDNTTARNHIFVI